jgi:hypothetical protein
MFMKKYVLYTFLFLIAFHLPHRRALGQSPAFELAGTEPRQLPQMDGTLGWNLNVGNIEITQLGVFDEGGDGLARPHAVGLWVGSGDRQRELLASVVIPAGTEAPLINGYRYMPISPVLTSDLTGQYGLAIGAYYQKDDSDSAVLPVPVYRGGFPVFSKDVRSALDGLYLPGPAL